MTTPSPLRSDVRFGAFLVYSPRGQSETSSNSRRVRDALKHVLPPGFGQIADRLARDYPTTPLIEILGPDVTLVPAPRSTPLVSGALWPAQRLADELRTRGLGRDVVPLVIRATPVQKSAFAGPGSRPTPLQHFESLAIEPHLVNPSRITIVDDVVTKGATLLAVASRLSAVFPEADIRAFAMLRAMGLQPDVDQIVDPCVGSITLTPWGDAQRSP